MPHIP